VENSNIAIHFLPLFFKGSQPKKKKNINLHSKKRGEESSGSRRRIENNKKIYIYTVNAVYLKESHGMDGKRDLVSVGMMCYLS